MHIKHQLHRKKQSENRVQKMHKKKKKQGNPSEVKMLKRNCQYAGNVFSVTKYDYVINNL